MCKQSEVTSLCWPARPFARWLVRPRARPPDLQSNQPSTDRSIDRSSWAEGGNALVTSISPLLYLPSIESILLPTKRDAIAQLPHWAAIFEEFSDSCSHGGNVM